MHKARLLRHQLPSLPPFVFLPVPKFHPSLPPTANLSARPKLLPSIFHKGESRLKKRETERGWKEFRGEVGKGGEKREKGKIKRDKAGSREGNRRRRGQIKRNRAM